MTLYCPTCRTDLETTADAQPPYAAIHRVSTGEHLHPITGEVLEA